MAAEKFKTMTLDQLDEELVKLKKEQFQPALSGCVGSAREHCANSHRSSRDRACENVRPFAPGQCPGGRLRKGIDMPKRILNGVVVSDKNDKTIVVEVERRFTHPLLKKTVRRSKKYQAHDEDNTFKTGDKVRIQESAPISRHKRWVALKQPG
jgi:small subunit ribosomal protein S17